MHFYRLEENNSVVAWMGSNDEIIDDNLKEVSQEEYENSVQELRNQVKAEDAQNEQSKDERIAELEAENAALLYQVLTGEELTDV